MDVFAEASDLASTAHFDSKRRIGSAESSEGKHRSFHSHIIILYIVLDRPQVVKKVSRTHRTTKYCRVCRFVPS